MAYVSFDNVAVGEAMATAMEPAIDALGLDQPQVVMLNGGEEDNNSFLFRDGYAETVEARVDAGDWALVDDQFVPGWGANAEGQTIMEQILVSREQQGRRGVRRERRPGQQDHQRGRGRGARSDPDQRAGRDGGGDPERRPRPADGERLQADPGRGRGHRRDRARAPRRRHYEDAATNYQSALASGGSGVAIIGINAADGTPADSATGDGVVPYVALVPIGVTIDNIMDTVIADGFRTIDEICTGDVAQTDFCQANA